MTVRPTLRCMREDLRIDIPTIDQPLNEIDHPLVRKANEQFTGPAGLRERIRSIDDIVLFKVKVQRWRGAVQETDDPNWLIAAGVREEGSRDDFYDALAAAAKAARTRYNSAHSAPLQSETLCQRWLPADEDHDRYRAEAGVRLLRDLRAIVHRLVYSSLLDGREHTAENSWSRTRIVRAGRRRSRNIRFTSHQRFGPGQPPGGDPEPRARL